VPDAVVSVPVCRCGAPMIGAAQNGHVWACEKNHQYRVVAKGTTICATAIHGDRGVGVDLGRKYAWRPSPGSAAVRAAPL
jgi:hypothetical protein